MAGSGGLAEELAREIEEEMAKAREEVEKRYPRGLAREIEEYVVRYLASAGVSKVLILDFVLPSVDLKSRTIRIEEEGRIVTREREMSPRDLQRISSLRSRFYQILRQHGAFKIGEKTWAILPGHERDLVREASEKLGEMNEIITKYGFPPRTLDLIEIYAPTRWVAQKIMDTIRLYRQDLEAVLDELRRVELEEKKRRILASKLSKIRRTLASLGRQLKALIHAGEEQLAEYVDLDSLTPRTKRRPLFAAASTGVEEEEKESEERTGRQAQTV